MWVCSPTFSSGLLLFACVRILFHHHCPLRDSLQLEQKESKHEGFYSGYDGNVSIFAEIDWTKNVGNVV